MDIETLKSKLREEDFAHVYEWSDKGNTKYPEHFHKGKVSFYITRGSVTFTGDIHKTIKAGERFDVPLGVRHSAIIGPEGCDWVVGEEIKGDS